MTPEYCDLARNHLGAYHLALNPEYRYVRFQQECIVPALHAVAEHRIQALMILICFGHGKTELNTLSFNAWLTGRFPRRKNMLLSYSDKFAKRFGRKIVNKIQSPEHREIFPDSQLSPTAHSGSYFTTTEGGEFYSAGFNGTITGQRVNGCISGEAEITTEIGPMRLDSLVRLVDRPKVLSYNSKSGELEYKAVLAAQKTQDADDRVIFILSNGKYLQTTPDHLIYDGSHYKSAETFSTSDRVYAIPAQSRMSKMWRSQGRARDVLRGLLSPNAAPDYITDLYNLRQFIQSQELRISENATAWRYAMLQFQMRDSFRVPAKFAQASASEAGLYSQDSSASYQHDTSNPMCRMRGDFYSARAADSMLFSPMCKYSSFTPNDGVGQFQVPAREELHEIIRRFEAVDFGTGQLSVCDLSRAVDFLSGNVEGQIAGTAESDNSSCRRGCDAQSSRESGDIMRNLSCGTSQIEAVSLYAITRLYAPSIPVYDLTVEGNHNFFANGVLVHNCLTIDDPIKNKEEATSSVIMQGRVEDYRSAAGTRLEGGSRLLTTTRWCTGDFVDRVLDLEGEVGQGGEWTVIKLPAEAGPKDLAGREPGQYLWPEFLGQDFYAKYKKDIPLWNAMCQQDPRKNLGKFFKRDWLCFYPRAIRPGKFPAYMLVDPARSKGKENDRTCAIVFVATPERRLLVVDALMARLDPGERGKELIRLARKWKPRRWLYEEIGLMSDTWYLAEEAKKAGLHIRPIAVGRKGPRHMMAKSARIESLIPDFREGRIWLPDIWGDKEEGRPPIPFPTMINDDEKEQNIVEYFVENEYVEYAGEGSVLHDEFLDALDRIHEPECGIIYPSADIVTVGRAQENWRNGSQSWESIY